MQVRESETPGPRRTPGSRAFHCVSGTHPGGSQDSAIVASRLSFRASTMGQPIEDAHATPGGPSITNLHVFSNAVYVCIRLVCPSVKSCRRFASSAHSNRPAFSVIPAWTPRVSFPRRRSGPSRISRTTRARCWPCREDDAGRPNYAARAARCTGEWTRRCS
jgi:hypothetical protein